MNYESLELCFQNSSTSLTEIRETLEVELDVLEQELLIAEINCRTNPNSKCCELLPDLRQKVEVASKKYFKKWGEIYRQELELV